MGSVKLKYLLIFFNMLISNCSTIKRMNSAEEVDLKGFEHEPIKIGLGINADNSNLIKREDPKVVILSFFEEFEDTVKVYHNSKEIVSWYINKNNNPSTSSGYSGKDIAIYTSKSEDVIIIQLVNKKKYIRFLLQNKFPLYTIQRYSNIWYVNPRSQVMILK
jgi:hypothetical protein